MRRFKALLTGLFAAFLTVTSSINAQTPNAMLSGTIAEQTGGAVIGARVTVVNSKTGVSTSATTNDEGVYIFASLQPGTYSLTAEKSGFRRLVQNNLILELSARIVVNVEMEVGQLSEEVVKVSAPLDPNLAIGANSVGGVINDKRVQDLPLPNRDALGLVLTQAGLVGSNFAGGRIGQVNVLRDGINVQDMRINQGVNSTIFTSTDLVDEIRVITSPADAEFGRGSGQVILTTKSGGNEFHGSAFEAHRNTVLNANTFFNNLIGAPRNELIRNQFGGRLGGPIIKNKTFFFVNYEGQRQRSRGTVTSTVLTDTARRGIFRFFPGVQNGNANAAVPTTDLNGSPVRPAAATGDLQSINLYTRDPNRTGPDPTGTIGKLIGVMPLPNNFRVGDGLNTAGHTWIRRTSADRDQINIRIDHEFTQAHRMTANFSREDESFLNGFMAQTYPDSPGGNQENLNYFYQFSFTSTLSPSLLNEFRAGAQRSRLLFNSPWQVDSSLVPVINSVAYGPDFASVTDPINLTNDPQGRISPLYQYTDTLTWVKGKHTFKGGFEVRFVSTNGFNSFDVFPRAVLGAGGAAVQGITAAVFGNNATLARNILTDLSGSLSNAREAFNAPAGPNPVYLAGEGKQRTWQQREFSWFFKDDFKVSRNLTLNLGVRYDWYGVPFEANGKTAGLVGGSSSIFGISGTSFADVYQPGRLNGQLTNIELVGKNSPKPDTPLFKNDWNNFAPAIGLSWAIPYFGENKTTLRIGYGWGYERSALRLIDVIAGDQPGLRTTTTFTSTGFLDLARLTLPLIPQGLPLETVPLTDRNQVVRVFDDNLRTPYVQNWNITLQRELMRDFTLDLRYVGSKGTKLIRTANINETNIFENGILSAFQVTQTGGSSDLLNQIFMGLNVPGVGVVNGTTLTGSEAVRRFTTTQGFFATNSAGSFANYLNTTTDFTGVRGGLLRRVGLPENFVIANPQFAGANLAGNYANSSFHSFQAEIIKRFSRGWTLQANYTWSRTLGEEDGSSQELLDSFRNGRDRRLEKKLLSFHVPHVFRSSGLWELPFGPGRKFLGNSPGWLSRIVELWQVGVIYNHFAGSPISFTAPINTFNFFGGDNTPTQVGNLPRDFVKVRKTENGVVFNTGYNQVSDPSLASMTPALAQLSTLRAITDSSGNLVLVNPLAGNLGSLSQAPLLGPGSFRFDFNIIKRVRFTETANLEIRVDMIDALNTPIFDDYVNGYNTNINSTNFGRVTVANGARVIVLGLRVNF